MLTNVRFEERILMYKGFLRAFGLQQDGRFSYIVLSDVARLYLTLAKAAPETSAIQIQRMIGGSTPGSVIIPNEPSKPKKRRQSLFVIEGEDIANAVFDILETEARPLKKNDLRELLRQEAKAIGVELTEADLDELSSGT